MEKASGIIISALGDSPLRVVLEADDDPKRMLKLLDARYASNRTVSRIAVQTQLFRMRYTDQTMSTYADKYTSLFSQLEQMGKGAAIPADWRPHRVADKGFSHAWFLPETFRGRPERRYR